MTLDEIAIKHGTDKATQHPVGAHGYTPHYAIFFEQFRDSPIKLLEIGVGGGESIRTWLEYFTRAKVFGIDLVRDTNPWNTPNVNTDPRYTFVSGDQASESFWSRFHLTHGGAWDIIIDDGGHEAHQIKTSFRCMWLHVNYGGLYCIEDLAYSRPLDLIKDQIERVNQETEVASVYCSKELAIIKKKGL